MPWIKAERKRHRQNTDDFYGNETILYNTVMIVLIIIHFAKFKEWTKPKVNLNVNYSLCMIMIFQCGSLIVTKKPIIVWDFISGGGCGCEGTCVIWGLSSPSAPFCYESKIVLNIYILKIKILVVLFNLIFFPSQLLV